MAGNTFRGSYPDDHPVYQQGSSIFLIKKPKDEPESCEDEQKSDVDSTPSDSEEQLSDEDRCAAEHA